MCLVKDYLLTLRWRQNKDDATGEEQGESYGYVLIDWVIQKVKVIVRTYFPKTMFLKDAAGKFGQQTVLISETNHSNRERFMYRSKNNNYV